MTYKALKSQNSPIKKALALIHGIYKRRDWASLKKYLGQNYPNIARQFDRVDEDGFKAVGQAPFDLWTKERSPEPTGTEPPEPPLEEIEAQAMKSVQSVSPRDRHRLIDLWAEDIRQGVTNELFESARQTDRLHQELANIHDEVDRRVLETADVIGVTTTELAKKIATLKRMRCKVVICEEAGEVMEPHMLSTLLPSVEHFIQIGDHQQLRPQINNYDLSLESPQGALYQLDRSQFERLSVWERGRPEFPVAQLNVRRRMRPEISTLIRETLYPRLVDHDSTRDLPDVVGMRKNFFWLDHDNIEEGPAGVDLHQKSHSNLWEVDMVHALVRHIVRQGVYSSSDIAVLTPYTGQLQKLRAKMRDDFEIVFSDRDEEALTKEGFP